MSRQEEWCVGVLVFVLGDIWGSELGVVSQ